jgi:hypothetical protein
MGPCPKQKGYWTWHNLMRCHLTHAQPMVHTHIHIIYKHVTGSLLHHDAAQGGTNLHSFPDLLGQQSPLNKNDLSGYNATIQD